MKEPGNEVGGSSLNFFFSLAPDFSFTRRFFAAGHKLKAWNRLEVYSHFFNTLVVFVTCHFKHLFDSPVANKQRI